MIQPAPRPLHTLLLFLVASLLGGVLSACGGEGPRDAAVHRPRLVQTESGERIFMGTLVNGDAAPIPIAEIEVALYDDDGSRIETMRIQVEDIPARDSVEFNQTIDSDQPIQQAQVQRVLVP